MRVVTSAEGSGPPAVVHKSSKVSDVVPDTAIIALDNGSSFSGDLVLGADGIGVRDHRSPSPGKLPTGSFVYRGSNISAQAYTARHSHNAPRCLILDDLTFLSCHLFPASAEKREELGDRNQGVSLARGFVEVGTKLTAARS